MQVSFMYGLDKHEFHDNESFLIAKTNGQSTSNTVRPFLSSILQHPGHLAIPLQIWICWRHQVSLMVSSSRRGTHATVCAKPK